MTALPTWTSVPLTAAEYAALPEREGRYELQEGAIVVAGSPVPDHQNGVLELAFQVREQTPSSEASFQRVRDEGGLLRAADVLLAVEILSRSTRRTDSVIKRAEYADAGIGHYWILDLLDGPSLTGCHLAGEFGYVDDPPVRGLFSTTDPFPARIDLDRLR